MSKSLSYEDSGVNIHEGYKAVEMMKKHVKSTYSENVLADLGTFGGLFRLDMTQLQEPILVSGTDGVGTKLKIAFLTDIHDTVGQDLVAMCVNDILCHGATPLFFLDYLATGHLQAEKAAQLVKGVADGCRQAGCALIGGETAEMPGFYSEGEYDMAGFAVGVVDKSKLLTGEGIRVGDVLIGISSSGIHSNGYSLVRKLFFEHLNMKVEDYIEELGETLGAALLKPTRIYVKPVLSALNKYAIKGICHITGGGFFENIPRMFKDGLKPVIKLGSWEIPPLFTMMAREGNIDEQVMYNTFNMGIGMVLAVSPEDADAVLEDLNEYFPTYKIGEVLEGTKEVELWRG